MSEIEQDSYNFSVFQRTVSLEVTFPEFEEDHAECHCKMVLAGEGKERLTLLFEGVTDLNIGNLQKLWIVIESVKGHQWDQINYKISEAGDDNIGFYCRSFRHNIS